MEAITNHNMTYKTFSRGLIVGLYMIFFHVSDHTVQNLFILFHSQNAFSVINDGVGSSCIKACDDLSVFIFSYRELCLVAVMVRRVHSHDRLHREILKTADPLQMATDFFLLEFQLLLIG